MEFTSADQWAVAGLLFLLGCCIGFLLNGGAKRWRQRYQDEAARRQADKERADTELRTLRARVEELERDRPASRPVNGGDDLSLIRGVGQSGAERLHTIGIHRYEDIAHLSVDDERRIEKELDAEPGYIAREHWREQAAMLAEGQTAEHARRYDGPVIAPTKR